MALASSCSVALTGAVGHVVDVQADVSCGVVTTTMVGRVDATLAEARDRCRTAVTNAGFGWPNTRRVTILLAPADLAKQGSHYDLPIALAVLAASDHVPPDRLQGLVLLGELGLEGGLRCVTGVLPMVMAAASQGITRFVVPEPQVEEAALVPGVEVLGMRSLAQVVAHLKGEEVPEAPPVPVPGGRRLLEWRGEHRGEELDLRDVIGLPDVRFAAEVAAAGGHHLLLSGPKGTGKTTLAERIPGLLPDLDREEALEVMAVQSLLGGPQARPERAVRPPFVAPHHDASRTAVLGGGSGRVRPGAVSRAHAGVLFLDEFPLFRSDVIESLRQPLESGEITVARGEESATFPARGMVVLACNPCPCGNHHTDVRRDRCTCREVQRRDYQRRLSGPIVDRIDITRRLDPVVGPDQDPFAPPESTQRVRARVEVARRRQHARFAQRSWRLNAHVPGAVLRADYDLDADGRAELDRHVFAGGLSRRGATRVHRVAWTLADLWGDDRPRREHVQVALALRLGEALPVWALDRSRGAVA